jgi:TusA-related sulfurtransferase
MSDFMNAASTHNSEVSVSKPDKTLDLRGISCPINFVRTKLQLQQLPANALLEVWIDAGEPVAQVPDSLRMDGYGIEQLTEKDGYYALQVRNSQP